MKDKTREIKFDVCIDGSELTRFIEDNSDYEWNDICDLEREAKLYGDEGRAFGFLEYLEDPEDIYKSTKNRVYIQSMINRFYEAYNLDKSKGLIILFTD